MAKLSERDLNIVVVVGAVVVFGLFAYFCYEDNEAIKVLQQQQEGVKVEISKALQEKKQIPDNQTTLYVLKESYHLIQKMLPGDKEILQFYNTLDKFRTERSIKPWDSFETAEGGLDEGKGKDGKKQQLAQPAKPAPGKPATPTSLIETAYTATIPVTLNQLGELLSAIENYERFYGVSAIRIAAPNTEGESKVNLSLVSFTYSDKTPFDPEKLKILLKDFPPAKLEEANARLKKVQDQWSREQASWIPLPKNPLMKESVIELGPTVGVGKGDKDVTAAVTVVEDPAKDYQELEKLHQELEQFARVGLWGLLNNKLQEKVQENNHYEARLQRVTNVSKEQAQRDKLGLWQAELRDWKKQIRDADIKEKAKKFVEIAEKQMQDMDRALEEGKSKGSQSILENLLKTLNIEFVPQLKEYLAVAKEIPQLSIFESRAKELARRADNQIKIMQLASKIQIQGIIYWANKPQHSVAFIDKKAVRKNDPLIMGFVVHDIKEEEVILRYQEDTVSIRLKRGIKTASTKEKTF